MKDELFHDLHCVRFLSISFILRPPLPSKKMKIKKQIRDQLLAYYFEEKGTTEDSERSQINYM
jgi:hypothetical protein